MHFGVLPSVILVVFGLCVLSCVGVPANCPSAYTLVLVYVDELLCFPPLFLHFVTTCSQYMVGI